MTFVFTNHTLTLIKDFNIQKPKKTIMKKRLLFTDKHYYNMLRKFHQYRERLRSLITGGQFFLLPTWERLQMVKKLQILFKRINKANRGARLKIAGTTAAFAMLTSLAMAQGPFEQITGNNNPLGGKNQPVR